MHFIAMLWLFLKHSKEMDLQCPKPFLHKSVSCVESMMLRIFEQEKMKPCDLKLWILIQFIVNFWYKTVMTSLHLIFGSRKIHKVEK